MGVGVVIGCSLFRKMTTLTIRHYSPTSSSLSPKYHMIWKPSVSSPVPSRSPRAVRKGIATLSGSIPILQTVCTIQSATRRRMTTCKEREEGE